MNNGSMNPLESAITRLREHLAALLILRKALAFLAIWLFIWGTGVIVLRVAFETSSIDLLWGLLAAPLVVAVAAVAGLRELPRRTQLRAVLDKAGGCGGLLMAAEEQPLGAWQESLPRVAPVRVRWQGGRSWAAFAAGVIFVLVGLLFPLPPSLLAQARALEIGREVEKLAAQIDVLKEEKLLEPERADSLKDKLKQMKDQSSSEDPVKTLEALDHLQKMVAQKGQEAAEEAAGQSEKLAKAESLAEGLRRSTDALDPKARAEAMAQLADLVQKAADEAKVADKLAKLLDPDTLQACKDCKLSAEDLKKLADALKANRKEIAKLLEKLRDAKLIDPEILARCAAAGMCDAAELARLLKEHAGKYSALELMKKADGLPGRGGVTEGRGDAALTWKDPTTEEGAKFKEETLPPGALADLKKSLTLGVSTDRPDVDKKGGPSRPGALNQATAGGGSAHTPVLLPRHRGAVERYFARPPAKSGKP
jgi:hypothetical protein